MAKIDPRFIPKLPDFSVVDGYAYTGTEYPTSHNESNLFLNIESAAYSVFENNTWGEPISAEGKIFISANENKIYSVKDGNVTQLQPDNLALYFTRLNLKLICCYDNKIVVINSLCNTQVYQITEDNIATTSQVQQMIDETFDEILHN